MTRGIKTGGRDWKSGESGNPKGRPKGEKAMTDLAREYLNGSQEIVVSKGKQKHTVLLKRKEMFVRAVFQAAIKGNGAAQRPMWNYIDGLPPLSMSLEGRLVNLNYDMDLSLEDGQRYAELLSQFFLEPGALGGPDTREGAAAGAIPEDPGDEKERPQG